jgi:hypothetical protein
VQFSSPPITIAMVTVQLKALESNVAATVVQVTFVINGVCVPVNCTRKTGNE